MSILSETKTTLENHLREGNLILNKDLIPFENIKAFLESLPNKQLLIAVPSPDNISLSGQTFPQELIIRAKLADYWNIKGIGDRLLNITQITLSSSQSNEQASVVTTLIIDGLLNLKAKQIPVQGRLIAENRLKFNLTNSTATNFSLSEIADYATHSAMVEYLPTGVDIFNHVTITVLDLDFSFDSSVPTLLSITCNPSVSEWSIINNFTTLKNLGVVISSKYSPWNQDQLNLSFGGNIHGTLHIGHDYDIIIYFQGRNFWELTLIPANGNILPGLSELAELAGGDNLKTTVQNGLNSIGLGEISIQSVSIGFDLQSKKLSYISMRSQIAVAGVKVNLFTRLPNFEFAGSKSKDTSISLKALIQHYFIQAEDFPELDITEFVFTAYPSASLYTIHTIIQDVWKFKIARSSIAIAELELELTKSGNSISGSITASLMVAGVSIFILANSPENKGNGWQFEGKTATGNEIHLGTLINELATKFGTDTTLPSSVSDLIIENIGVSFNTKTKDFTFTCDSKFPIDNQEVDITVNINIIQQLDSSYKKHFDGHITIGSLKFALIFDTDKTSTNFLAAYHDDQTIKIKELIGYIDDKLKEDIPEGLEISLQDALFAYSKQPTLTNFLFGLNIGGEINLSNLPLVGREFPPNQTLKISLQVLVTKANFTATELQTFNTLYTGGGIKLPTTDLNKRLELIPSIQLGSEIQHLELPITINKQSGQIEETTPSQDNNVLPSVVTTSSSPTQISDSIKWFKLQKSFGPVHFPKIGVKCQDQKLWFLLDASLATAGLTISLDGLAFSSPLTELKPEFHLNGIGIDYRSDTVEIGGAFLRKQVKQDGQTFYEYSGAAILRTQTKGKQLTLSAFGSYTYYKGHPSLFIYALLDYPLGGAPFLFVTGLAAGFGYNRTLRLPEKVEDVAQFPLVKIATGQAGVITEINQVLEPLKSFIPPATGELFFAVGIKFTSFKIIDSFALLTVQLGNRSEINILGLSTLIAPPGEAGVEPIAKAQLAFRATYLPEEGFLKVEAALLPGAYLFSGNCRLSGRFAFYSWFSGQHEGDFVLTLGGYHPDFNIPEHYPKLPRLQLNWQVDNKTSIKGDAYFALCSHTLMAGGHLELTYQSGDLKAWLRAGADFLIAWKPYHYDARIYVTIGASYTFNLSLLFTTVTKTITAEVGADLHLWGPDFGGTATIHIWVVQINIDFGSRSSQQPNPIDWNSFKASFLPKDKEVCSIAVQDGLVRKIGKDESELGIINPKRFSLVTNSAIPSKHAYKREASSEREIKVNETNTNLGIASMAVLSDDLKTEHIITITRNGQNVEEEFQYIPILKKVPIGLWGQPPSNDKPLMSSVNGQQFVESALSGFEIKPKEMHNPGQTQAVDRVNLQYEPEPAANGYSWETQIPFQADSSEDSDRRDRIRNTVTKNSRRENLLKSLGFDPDRDVDLNEAIANDFIIPPQIKHLKNIS